LVGKIKYSNFFGKKRTLTAVSVYSAGGIGGLAVECMA